jgi:aspartate carbamoyltransferase catalytic subunit
MGRMLLSVDNLSDRAVGAVLHRAAEHRSGAARLGRSAAIVALVFLESSLRTRVGFTAAAYRLGWNVVDVLDRRANPRSMPESWTDTVRTVAGYSDVVVARTNRPLVRAELEGSVPVPLLNAGDAGPRAEHPSQALIDVFAMEQALGPVSELRVAICGDLRMRAVRSLLALLGRMPPAALALVTVDALRRPDPLPAALTSFVEYRRPWQLGDIDVLYVAGIPHGSVGEDDRTRLRVDRRTLAALPEAAVVLSPMPVIDEIASNARGDRRLRLFEQSDGGLFVRMALLEYLVDGRT